MAIASDFLQQITDQPLTTTADYYARRLPENPKAVAFIQKELGLSLQQAAQQQIGFSDRTLGRLLPTKDSQAGRDLRDQLVRLGLFKPSGHEALRGCVTIPLLDDDGNLTGILGRRIDRNGKGPKEITIGEGQVRPARRAGPSHTIDLDETTTAKEPERLEEQATTEDRITAEVTENTEQAENTEQPSSTDAHDPSFLVEDDQVIFIQDDRRYRVRGLEKNTTAYQLKVNLMASRDSLVHLDSIDLVKARSRRSFIKATAAELFVDEDRIKKDIGMLLLRLETLREQQIAEAKEAKAKPVQLTQQETEAALELLRDPNLLERIVADMDVCGIVGEATNKLTGYLAATSRKLRSPLAIIIQSSSSAGKTSLMDAILEMMPEEETLRYSGITGQSLYYLDESIQHNILAISEDEGIGQASYALKLLQSEGELRHATVTKKSSGRMGTETYCVQGPVQIMLTTTALEVDEELVNRCLVLSVDESRGQTGAIQIKQRQARSLEELQAAERSRQIRRLHQNAQRLLKPLRVFNPYASQLTFPDNKTRLRRDHEKYLTLIDTVALLHQHQRPVGVTEIDGQSIEFIRVEPSDIAVANGIAGEVLGRSLDVLAPQTRRLLQLLHQYVASESKATGVSRHAFRFTRRDVRDASQWSDSQLHKHLTRLADLEYLVVHRGKHGRRYVYELLYSGEGHEGQPFLMGLIDPAKLKTPMTTPTLGG